MKKKKEFVFYDPRHSRVFYLALAALIIVLVVVYIRWFYPNQLFFLRMNFVSRRMIVIYYVNRIVAVLLALNLTKIGLWRILARRRERNKKDFDQNYKPRVSVIIPAYNEEKVIEATVKSVLASTYPSLEILVVDDGSTDGTRRVVEESFKNNRRVKLICKENGGKATALNRGIKEAGGYILVMMDADTMMEPDAIGLMVRHFSNPKVAAVAGNTRVGNVKNLITGCQRIEYIRDFNLIKNAMASLNCIAVVPGALGAWRKEAVEAVGGLKSDTLGEDRELTIELLKAGGVIRFEKSAMARTEAPDTVRGFLRQRFRWTYSTLQCTWKYKSCLLNPKYPAIGFFMMPELVFAQLFMPVLTLFTLALNLFWYAQSEIIFILISWAAFTLLELGLFWYSVSITKEKHSIVKDSLLLVAQKIVYGVLCTFTVYRSLISAFAGVRVGWNKVERTGEVEKSNLGSA